MIRQCKYDAIHSWLKTEFGKPQKYESHTCDKTKRIFSWCLKKNKQYEFKRENFIRLCTSCHRKYDHKYDNVRKFIPKFERINLYPSDGKKLRILAKRKGGKTLPADIINKFLKL